MKVIVILSGGIDSTTLLWQLVNREHSVKALSFYYGQRHFKELEAARTIAGMAEVAFTAVDIGDDVRRLISKGSLTGGEDVPHGHYESESMKDTVVPNRNMIFLSVGIAWAITSGFDAVAYGAHAGDHAIYPDCRPMFVKAMRQSALACNVPGVTLLTPFIDLRKHDIVQIGMMLKAPLDKTWSCYQGGKQHCGKCGTCVERREAFETAGVQDPTEYEE